MKIAFVNNLAICEESEARSCSVVLHEEKCDVYIFTGNMYKFPNSISLDQIALFQEILEVLSLVGIVVVFTEVCTWAPHARKIHVSGSCWQDFAYEEVLTFRGEPLGEGITENGVCRDIKKRGHFSILVEDNNIDDLPEIEGAIRFLEVRYRNCSPLFLSYVQNLYGRIDSRVDLGCALPLKLSGEPAWELVSAEWSNVYCYESGRINFRTAPAVFLICGANGSGKSSIINILLAGLFGKQISRTLKKGSQSGEIKLEIKCGGKLYVLRTTFPFERSCYCEGVLIEEPDLFKSLQPYDIFCGKESTKGLIKSANLELANLFLREICDFSVSIAGNAISVCGNESAKYSACSSGQKFLIELALKITSTIPKPQVFFIDECIERLDQNHIEKCIRAFRLTNHKFVLIGHRGELRILPSFRVSTGRKGSQVNIL